MSSPPAAPPQRQTKTKTKKEKEAATTESPKKTIPPVFIHHIPSSGFILNSANATHPFHKPEPTTKIHTGTGLNKNMTMIIKLNTHKIKHTSLEPITLVAIATGSTNPLPAPTAAATSTKASTTGAAQKVLAGGMLAGLGAVAALVL